MEERQLLEYCWKHKLFPEELKTENGEKVEIIDVGLYDRRTYQFFNAKMRIGGTLWVGNVKILFRAEEWRLHSYDINSKYENVILVVSRLASEDIYHSNGTQIPVICPEVPENIRHNFEILMSEKGMIHCHHHIVEYNSTLLRHSWLAAMQAEHLEEEANSIKECFEETKDWQTALESQLFRAFGFGVNDAIMLNIYRSINRSISKSFFTSHHVDDLFQLEAVILGQAGLLELETVREEYQKSALNEGYFAKLRNEWLYLAHRYAMKKPPRYHWKPYGNGRYIRPHVKLSMLANLIYQSKHTVSNLLSTKNLFAIVTTHATPYWQMHSEFGKETPKSERMLTQDRQSRILIDCHIPFLFAYGRAMDNEEMCDRAFDFMEEMKPYKTHETAWFERFGIIPKTAGDTFALCQLKSRYCDNRDCMRCRFGYEFVKKYEYTNK